MPFHTLIYTIHQWQRDNAVWLDGPFEWLDAETIKRKTLNYLEEITEMGTTFKARIKLDVTANKSFKFTGIADDPDPMQQPAPLKLCWQALNEINEFKAYLPLALCMCNPALRKRHWEEMSLIRGFDLMPNAGTTLRKVMGFDLMCNIEKYEAISKGANMELALQEEFFRMHKEWNQVSFEMTFDTESEMTVFSHLNRIESVLAEHLIQIEEMRASNFVKPIDSAVAKFLASLERMQAIIAEWDYVQTWKRGLDPIFSYPEIEKCLCAETDLYLEANKILSSVQEELSRISNSKQFEIFSEVLERILKVKETFEEISKNVTDYLEEKRLSFTRFFFLSEGEIQKLLFELLDVEKLHVYLRKCFTGVKQLLIKEERYIHSIIGSCGENLKLLNAVPIYPDSRSAEKWLIQLESEINKAVRESISQCHNVFDEKSIFDAVINFPYMAIFCTLQIQWTADIQNCFISFDRARLTSLHIKYIKRLNSLVETVKDSLTGRRRNIAMLLIILTNKQKEVIELLLERNICTHKCFEWIAQMRYYLHNDDIKVSMFNTTVHYGYEYEYHQELMVNTALTDRCFHTLMQAHRYHIYGAFIGPTSTGKSQTVKSLANSIAVQFYTFDCNNIPSYKFLSCIFKGLICCGAWLCFEDFDKLHLEVLSAISQNIMQVSRATSTMLKSIVFEGSTLNLQPTGHICIVMKNCRSMHTELPDNLKILFRTVSMMVLDVSRIVEVELFAAGFSDAKSLASKLVMIYKLLSEQLEKKCSHKLGICAMKIVLRTATYLKLNLPEENERTLFLRSLIDITIPRLRDSEVIIFKGIIDNMFPEVILPPPDFKAVMESLEIVCNERSLSMHDTFKLKVLQTFELMSVHSSLILIGDPFTGKTEILHSLASILLLLRKEGNKIGANVRIESIVPSVTNSNQLFGCQDEKSGLWKDGLCSKILRNFAKNDSFDKKWLIFDGPLQGEWLEKMATMLDSNKTLYLSSSERLNVVDNVSIIFETLDIAQASPAIVSRCGTIYIESSSIDWTSYASSQFAKHEMYRGHEKILVSLVDWAINACLRFLEQNSTSVLNVRRLNLVMSVLNLFELYLKDACIESAEEKGGTSHFVIWANAALMLSIAWCFGGYLVAEINDRFNAFCVTLWNGSNVDFPKPRAIKDFDIMLPNEGLIQDNFYVFKGIGNWKYWGDVLKGEKMTDNLDTSQGFVPTINTIKYTDLLLKHIKHHKPFIIRGETAVGKTSLLQNLLRKKLLEEEYAVSYFTFVTLDSVGRTQRLLLSKLNKIKRKHYSPQRNRFCIDYIDDLNMDIDADKPETRTVLELLRQYLAYGHLYDMNEFERIIVHDLMFLLTITVGNDRRSLCPRFLRYFNVYSMYPPSTDNVSRIFSNVLFANLKRNLFAADVLGIVNSMVNATVAILNAIISTLRPTPSKLQYCFDLRDISRIISGSSLLQKESVETKVTFMRLWAHEVLRVFGDRMVNTDDKLWLFTKIKETVKVHFKDSFETAFDHLPKYRNNQITIESFDDLVFGNFMNPEKEQENRKYEEISSMKVLKDKVDCFIVEYNKKNKKQLDVVSSRYTLECLIKISRILSIPGGNLLIVSSIGSGKRSLTSLAAFLQEQRFVECSVHWSCDPNMWRRNLRTILRECGGLRRNLTFFISDRQMNDALLSDIASLLNTGEIPDLFSGDDRQSIIEMTRLNAQSGDKNAEMSIRSVMNYFTEECKNRLHVVLGFSCTSNKFKACMHHHRNLIKQCTINIYEAWPREALVETATKYLRSIETQEDRKASAVQACIEIYENAKIVSDNYHRDAGRDNYIVPSSFLHMIKLYSRLVTKKQGDIIATRNRYLTGLDKLELAAKQVEQMKATLTILKPQLELSARQTMITMKEVENENVTVEKATILVKEEEEVANRKAKIAGTLKTECEADLAVAIPILEDAVAALNTLKPTDITLVKAMKNPPDTVKLVMAAVCVMLSVPPDRTIDPVTGKKSTDYWGPSKRILGDMNFLQNLKEYDKDDIPTAVMQVIKKTYMTDNSFMPQIVAKASSAAEGLCKWVRAMVSYDEVAKVVAPKKEKLLAAQKECDEAAAFLNEKRRTLFALNAKLAALNNSLQETLERKLKLEKEVENCTIKLKKAESLISSLGGEKDRWTECADNLQTNYENLIGDMMLSCGIIAYTAPYSITFRDEVLNTWKGMIENFDIPCARSYNFVHVLGLETEIHHWYACGLSKTRFSTENAIIMSNSDQWCLFIDSQNQANLWIKKIEKRNDLKIVKITDADYMSIIESSIENGNPVLIENVKEDLEIILDPVLLKDIYKDGEFWYLDTGKGNLKYSHNFRLYITTRLLNPRYSHEIFKMLTIIDFSIPNEALQDRLLDIVIAKEKPELQEKFEDLVTQDRVDKNVLRQQEDKILSTLSSTTTNILEDESAIKTLDSSKSLSLGIIKKREAAKTTKNEINKFRDAYIQFVKHSAELFGTLNALSKLNHMYRFSFSWFIQLYIKSIETSNRSVILDKRLKFLKSSFTQNLYLSVCRSLLEEQKILYSFLLCSKLMVDAGETTEEEIRLFVFLDTNKNNSECSRKPDWLSIEIWKNLCNIDKHLLAFNGLTNDIRSNTTAWKAYQESETMLDNSLPEPWNEKLSEFQKLILVRTVRPDKIVHKIVQLIENHMGNALNQSPKLKVSQSYSESSCSTPIVFILPSCSSILSLISDYATTKGYSSKFASLSIGKGQEKRAETLIAEAQREGGWVLLENCHLAIHWMRQLEKICEQCDKSGVSMDFRLWISSYSTKEFPLSVLQNSIKVTNDHPLELKHDLLRLYRSEPIGNKDFFEGCPGRDKEFSKLLFGLCLFHVIVRERNDFGAQGWNLPYDFDHSDLQISATQLQDFINGLDIVSPDVLLYFIGKCNYGGKVMSEFDQKRLESLLEHYCLVNLNDDYLETTLNKVECLIPRRCEYNYVIKHIENFPLELASETLESDVNAIIARDAAVASGFLKSLFSMNQISALRGESFVEDEVLSIIDVINQRLLVPFETNKLHLDLDVSLKPLNMALLHEVKLLNNILQLMKNNLDDLKSAFQGCILLDSYLEKISVELYNNRVPRVWGELRIGIATKTLSIYVRNLERRLRFIEDWKKDGENFRIQFDAVSSPKMFLLAIALTFSMRANISVEQINFEFEVQSEDRVDEEHTYVIRGLHLTGARWNLETNSLSESSRNTFWQEMQPIYLRCTQNKKIRENVYECPVYLAPFNQDYYEDFGTKLDEYFVTCIPLNTAVDGTHWIKRGVALFCQTE
ncbi:hypothetical protein KM043_010036 [Ampulex compressa]|nr:hypothetical protein KM043_010036 [Ampulex compressa]